jgi:4-hydroxy-tetrahydrodipicolinate synthase
MTRHPLTGVYAAALTPITPASSPDLEAVAPYLAFLAARGCHGALLFGTTGEGPSFSPAERGSVWQTALRVREQFPDFRLLAGTGTPSLTETIDLTRAAFDLGYDGVVVLPPYYFRKATDEGLFHWFRELIQKAVPKDGCLFGYHFPGVAGIGFSLDLLAHLKDAFPVQFAGWLSSPAPIQISRSRSKTMPRAASPRPPTSSPPTCAKFMIYSSQIRIHPPRRRTSQRSAISSKNIRPFRPR